METATEPVHASSDTVETPSGQTLLLLSADEVRALDEAEPKYLTEIVDWCEHFLGRPSALVGRTGNVCPFVPESMMRGSLKFTVVRLRHRGEAAIPEIEEVVETLRDYFLSRERVDGKIDIFGSFVMIFPDVGRDEAEYVIETPQRKLKPSFVKEGLMLGEFHPLCASPGLRNPGFRQLRSPIPLLVIRHMVESDIDFLGRPLDPPDIRVQSLRAYLQFLGSSLSIASQTKARAALKVAEADILS